jgi:hypothetical protein
MKKGWMIMVSCLLATSLMTGSAFAKSDNAKSTEKKEKVADESKDGANGTEKEKEKNKVKAEGNNNEAATVTNDTYKNQGHKGYKGLLNAMNNVKDKPAGVVIAELLLTKYNTQLTDEMKAELEAIQDKDAALSLVADMLANSGSVTDAVYVEKEAILANIKNIDSYKKLGKLYDKMGKKGVKLYVNGEEPSTEVAPIIRNGSTLVPFRAITEALKATVEWNGDNRSVTVIRDDVTVILFIDSKIAYVNGEKVILEVPATIEKGSTVVPARFVSESLNAIVKWESESQSVVIYEE